MTRITAETLTGRVIDTREPVLEAFRFFADGMGGGSEDSVVDEAEAAAFMAAYDLNGAIEDDEISDVLKRLKTDAPERAQAWAESLQSENLAEMEQPHTEAECDALSKAPDTDALVEMYMRRVHDHLGYARFDIKRKDPLAVLAQNELTSPNAHLASRGDDRTKTDGTVSARMVPGTQTHQEKAALTMAQRTTNDANGQNGAFSTQVGITRTQDTHTRANGTGSETGYILGVEFSGAKEGKIGQTPVVFAGSLGLRMGTDGEKTYVSAERPQFVVDNDFYQTSGGNLMLNGVMAVPYDTKGNSIDAYTRLGLGIRTGNDYTAGLRGDLLTTTSGLNLAAYTEVQHRGSTTNMNDNNGYYTEYLRVRSDLNAWESGLKFTTPLGHSGAVITGQVGYMTGSYHDSMTETHKLGGAPAYVLQDARTPVRSAIGKVTVGIPLGH